jgi:nicotinate-nucleotide adenylyltransferase
MGADNLALFHHWRDWRTIFRLMPVAVIDRPGWHLRALASPAARTFATFRVPESSAGRFADRPAPAWIFLSGPLSDLSSTAIRARLGR